MSNFINFLRCTGVKRFSPMVEVAERVGSYTDYSFVVISVVPLYSTDDP